MHTPGRVAPGRIAPGRITPGKARPGRAAPGKAAPGRAAPGRAAPGRPTPGRPVPGMVAPQPTGSEPRPRRRPTKGEDFVGHPTWPHFSLIWHASQNPKEAQRPSGIDFEACAADLPTFG